MMHTTKYGNKYTDQEWVEMQAYFKQEKANDEKISAQIEGLTKDLKLQLQEEGLGIEQVKTVVNLFRNASWVDANIQFTSQKRQDNLNDLWQRWDIAMSELYTEAMSQEGDLESMRLNIMEKGD